MKSLQRGKRRFVDIVPPPVHGLQANSCRTPGCENFGMPAITVENSKPQKTSGYTLFGRKGSSMIRCSHCIGAAILAVCLVVYGIIAFVTNSAFVKLLALLGLTFLIVGEYKKESPSRESLYEEDKPSITADIPFIKAPYIEADLDWTKTHDPEIYWYDDKHLLVNAMRKGVPTDKPESELFLWDVETNSLELVASQKPSPVFRHSAITTWSRNKDTAEFLDLEERTLSAALKGKEDGPPYTWDGSYYCARFGRLFFTLGFFTPEGKKVLFNHDLPKTHYKHVGKWPDLKVVDINPRYDFKQRNPTWFSSGGQHRCYARYVDKSMEGYRWIKLKEGHGNFAYEKLVDPYIAGVDRPIIESRTKGVLYYDGKDKSFTPKIINGEKVIPVDFVPKYASKIRHFEFNDGYMEFRLDSPKRYQGLEHDSCYKTKWFWANGKPKRSACRRWGFQHGAFPRFQTALFLEAK